MQHSLPALYLSIGLIALGNGSVYTPPVQTIIDWFPDRWEPVLHFYPYFLVLGKVLPLALSSEGLAVELSSLPPP